MRLRVFVLLSLLTGLAAPAHAAVVSMGKGPSFGQLKSACDAAGGEFVDQRADDLGYSCHVENCDGNGGECKIDCGTVGCTATTPIRLDGNLTLLAILQNGDAVLREPGATGTPGSLSSPGTTSAPPKTNGPGPLL